MPVTFQVVKNDWAKLAERLESHGGEIVQYAAEAALELSQILVPVASGDLKASGHIEPGEDATTWYLVYGTDHAWYPEFGTRHMSPEPYFLPGMDRARGMLPDLMSTLFDPTGLT